MSEHLENAFKLLATYKDGDDRKPLNVIDQAIVDSHGDAQARAELENRLVSFLKSDMTRNTVDFVCRKLKVMGTDACLPALKELLGNKNYSHLARYALQEMKGDAVTNALLESLDKISDEQKVGVIGTLGARGDNAAVAKLGSLLGANSAVAESAARALGAIGSAEAAAELGKNKSQAKESVIDSMLACAESMLAGGNKVGALKAYQSVAGKPDLPKHVKLAATRGMLACAKR